MMKKNPDAVVKVGVTGHRRLGDDPRTPLYVHAQCVRVLDQLQHLARHRGASLQTYSALAIGADQLFARAALGLHLPLIGVIPFADYPADFEGDDRRQFEVLLGFCQSVYELPRKRRSNEAYLAVGKWMVDETDYLVAVWNGEPAAGKGGTGDVVAYAGKKRRPILRINPAAAPPR